jgi:hypothetical protein
MTLVKRGNVLKGEREREKERVRVRKRERERERERERKRERERERERETGISQLILIFGGDNPICGRSRSFFVGPRACLQFT